MFRVFSVHDLKNFGNFVQINKNLKSRLSNISFSYCFNNLLKKLKESNYYFFLNLFILKIEISLVFKSGKIFLPIFSTIFFCPKFLIIFSI